MRAFAGWNVVFWLVLIPISIWTGWVDSPAFISYLSEIALVLSSLSWWQSGRVEVKQDENGDGIPDNEPCPSPMSADDDPGRRIAGTT